MNDVMARISAIRSRFVTGTTPVASAPASAASASDEFSSVLASTRASMTGDATGMVAGGTGGSAADASADALGGSSLATLARTLATATGSGSTQGTANRSTLALDELARRAYTGVSTPVPAAYDRYRDLIGTVATEEGVPASLLGAVVWSESGFDPAAVSPAGARGLAQLMPATADGLGVNIDDPADNLRGGARYLRAMLDRFGSVDLALAAYNAGPNAVARAGGIPAYQETQTYVTRVMARAAQLSGGAQA